MFKFLVEVMPYAVSAYQAGYFNINPRAIKEYVDAKVETMLNKDES